MRFTRQEILKRMEERVLILDGATGTYLQGLGLDEEAFRGEKFKNHPVPLKGLNDVLCLTQPEVIVNMHRAYIEAGADIIETNSFNGNRFSLADYALEDYVYEINKAAAEIARRAGGGVIVAGSMGPTSKTTSMSADVNDPGAREVTFQDLYETYHEQARGLIDGGADVLLVETVFDTLNAKAALKAITDLSEETGTDIPIMVSATLSDASGRTLSGQTVEAFCASVSHARGLLSIGLNCGFGAKQLLPWLRRLSRVAPCPVSVHPNAGLPNVMGGYDETPETFAETARQVLSEGLVNIYGGCCGTTPEHIAKVKGLRSKVKGQRSKVKGQRSKVKGQRSKVSGFRFQVSSFKSQVSGFLHAAEWSRTVGSKTSDRGRGAVLSHWRTYQRGRLGKVPQTHSGERLRGSAERSETAGGEGCPGDRHLHGRWHDRRHGGNAHLPQPDSL